jgi:hypothetical protein
MARCGQEGWGMQIIDMLERAQGGAAVANLGRTFNLPPDQVRAVIEAVVPELGRAIERNTLSRGGLADLVSALGQGHHQSYLDNPALLGRPEALAEGNAILGHVLGGKDASRGVAERASAMSGVPSSIIRMMLPVIMSMVMGGLAKSVSGGLGEILGRLGGARNGGGGLQMPRRESSGMPRLPDAGGMDGGGLSLPPDMGSSRGTAGTGGWGPSSSGGARAGSPGQIELNPDGGLRMPDSLPDFGGGMPAPRRGGDNPYGDLADILRRGLPIPRAGTGSGNPLPMPEDTGGGGRLPWPGGGGPLPSAPVGGGLLWRMIRGLIGSAFGFQSKGIMSWIIRMVLMRWGWALLRTVLGRGLGR